MELQRIEKHIIMNNKAFDEIAFLSKNLYAGDVFSNRTIV